MLVYFYVKEWERKITDEKTDALNNLKAEHKLQIEGLRRQFAQLDAQIKASEAIHIARYVQAILLSKLTFATKKWEVTKNHIFWMFSIKNFTNFFSLDQPKKGFKLKK